MGNYKSVSTMETKPILRITTHKSEMDWLFGVSIWTRSYSCWGLPCGMISLISGEEGVGKSRVTREIAKSISMNKNNPTNKPYPVVYFSLEEEMGTFAANAKKDGTILPPSFYISNESSLAKQIEVIRETEAMVVFVDSVNKVDEYKRGYSDARVEEVADAYRKIAVEKDRHIMLISMLNKEGETKGSTHLPHLVDTVLHISKSKRVLEKYGEGHFEVAVGKKNRWGRVGKEFYCVWKHYENKADTVSEHKYKDKMWAETHGLKTFDVDELVQDVIREQEQQEQQERQKLTVGQRFLKWVSN